MTNCNFIVNIGFWFNAIFLCFISHNLSFQIIKRFYINIKKKFIKLKRKICLIHCLTFKLDWIVFSFIMDYSIYLRMVLPPIFYRNIWPSNFTNKTEKQLKKRIKNIFKRRAPRGSLNQIHHSFTVRLPELFLPSKEFLKYKK